MVQQRKAAPSGGVTAGELLNTEKEYQRWMKQESIPIHSHIGGFWNVVELPRSPWARTGGNGCFLETLGTNQASIGMYVGEIPARQALDPQRHLYPEMLVVLQGRGSTQIWQREGGATRTFEWGEGSTFLLPHNASYRLINGSAEPVVYLGITRAPAVINVLHDLDVVFNSGIVFSNLYDLDSEEDFYSRSIDNRIGTRRAPHWETNFIPDVLKFALERDTVKVSDGAVSSFWMGRQWPNGHISSWGVGTYHKAHWHGPGAILVGFTGSGYVLIWPREAGLHPYADGLEETVTEIQWGKHSVYVPYEGAFHQHFNTGSTSALQLAIHGDRERQQYRDYDGIVENPLLMTIQKGGTLIEYEDEDPEIRRRFEDALKKNGVECRMPQVQYRN